MARFFLFFLLIGSSFFTFAEPPVLSGFSLLGYSESSSAPSVYYYGKNGSASVSKDDFSFLIQVLIKEKANSSGAVEYYKASISKQVCRAGYGEVRFLKLSGELSFKADYVKDGTSIGSSIGTVLCMTRV